MENTIANISVASDALPEQATQALNHLPGPKGHWLTGNATQLLPDPRPYLQMLQRECGDCFTVGFFRNRRAVIMLGPEAAELLLLDQDSNFSSRLGWDTVLPFFGRNILVRDFEDHRLHRKLMTHVFKANVLARYLEQMRPVVSASIADLSGSIDVYRQTKRMALDIAIRVFAGVTAPGQVDSWNADLSMVLANVLAHRIRLPGTRYSRALAARDRIRRRLSAEIGHRRGTHGEDLFSQLVNQRDEDGHGLSDQDIIDHMLGLLFAAHDTTASSLAMIFWLLAEHPDWQDRARRECQALHCKTGSTRLQYEDLRDLPVVEAVFKETLRMYAPIQFVPRRNVRAFSFQGHSIPANTWMLLAPQVTHFDPAYFSEPERFDPGRFLEADSPQPPFTFVPFGKGSHMCLGMHFAHMEIKAVLYELLLSRTLQREPGHEADLQYLPIVKPTSDLMVNFTPL